MKRFKFILTLLVSLTLLACGTFTEENLGFPQKVTFSKEGGEQVVKSNTGVSFTHAEIHDYTSGENGTTTTLEDDTMRNTFEWLQVEYQPHSTEVKIIAQPNNTQSRMLYIELYSGQDYHVIAVFQEASFLLE